MMGNSQGLDALKAQWPKEDWSQAEIAFQARLDLIPAAHLPIVLATYAAPVGSQLAH